MAGNRKKESGIKRAGGAQKKIVKKAPDKDPDGVPRGERIILSGRLLAAAVTAAFLVGAFVLYANALHGPFVFDDDPNIAGNEHIRISSLSVHALRDAAFESPIPNRPVANVSFALNYLAHGYSLAGFHVVNVIVHVLAAVFLFFLLKATLEICPGRSVGKPDDKPYSPAVLAFLAALVWFVNPVQTQAVSYVIQRMTGMAGMFFVLAMLLYVRGRLASGRKRWLLYGGSVLSGALAMGTKELALMLPVFVFVYEWFFFQDLKIGWLKKAVLPLAGAAAVMAVAGYFYLGAHPIEWLVSQYAGRDFTLGERLMTELRVVMLYVSLLVLPLPSRLKLDYDFPLSHSLVDPFTTLLSLAAVVLLAALSVYLARRERIASFAILWFLGNLVVESSIVPLELVYEHRMYVPSMFLGLAAVTLAARYVKPRPAFVGLVCIVAGVFSLWTWQRNAVWGDELAFWQDCVKKSPADARPHHGLGSYYYDNGDYRQAIEQYTAAIRLDPGYLEAYYSMGNAQKKVGNVNEALRYYAAVLKKAPENPQTYNNIGVVLMEGGSLPQALAYFRKAKATGPEYKDARYNLAFTLHRLGRTSEAVAELSGLVRMAPEYARAHCELGNIKSGLGNVRDAEADYRQAIRLDPGLIEAYVNLGNLLYARGDRAGALDLYTKALKINPGSASVYGNLGNLLSEGGQLDKAISCYRQALAIEPGNLSAYNGLGVALARKGDVQGAIEVFEEALRMAPSNREIMRNLTSLQNMSAGGAAAVNPGR